MINEKDGIRIKCVWASYDGRLQVQVEFHRRENGSTYNKTILLDDECIIAEGTWSAAPYDIWYRQVLPLVQMAIRIESRRADAFGCGRYTMEDSLRHTAALTECDYENEYERAYALLPSVTMPVWRIGKIQTCKCGAYVYDPDAGIWRLLYPELGDLGHGPEKELRAVVKMGSPGCCSCTLHSKGTYTSWPG